MTFQRPLSMVARRRSTLGNIPTLPGCSKRRKPPSFIRGTILEAGSSIICGKAGSINKLSPEKPSATAHGGDDHIITLPTHPPASFPDNKILGLFDPASVCRIKLQLVAVLLEKGFEFDVATRVVQTEYHNASSLLAAGSDQPGWHSMMDHMTKCLRRMMEGPSQVRKSDDIGGGCEDYFLCLLLVIALRTRSIANNDMVMDAELEDFGPVSSQYCHPLLSGG